ncbi:MAG: hypothetical protein U5R49_08490 [Deltaproteobacteria bacterium]|nr:hypothetical protein [Deltaproteobacteria bacterium]
MNYKHILYETKDRVGTMTLNRPEKRNALGKVFEAEMADCLKNAREKER